MTALNNCGRCLHCNLYVSMIDITDGAVLDDRQQAVWMWWSLCWVVLVSSNTQELVPKVSKGS